MRQKKIKHVSPKLKHNHIIFSSGSDWAAFQNADGWFRLTEQHFASVHSSSDSCWWMDSSPVCSDETWQSCQPSVAGFDRQAVSNNTDRKVSEGRAQFNVAKL